MPLLGFGTWEISDADATGAVSVALDAGYRHIDTATGYRNYGEDAAARLLFIARARRMGLSCEQVTSLLPVWASTNCGATQERVTRLIEDKQAEIADRIAELE